MVKGPKGPKGPKKPPPKGYKWIFRRYREDKSGNMLDAYKFGHKAWPMLVKDD